MRVSVREDDPGYIGKGQGGRYRVLLDGQEQHHVLTADEDAGIVVKHKRNPDGSVVINPDGQTVAEETLGGAVQIVDLWAGKAR